MNFFIQIVTNTIGWILIKLLQKGLSKEQFRKPPLGAWYYNPLHYGTSESSHDERKAEAYAHLKNAIAKAEHVRILTSTGWTTYASQDSGFLYNIINAKKSGTLQFLLLDPECHDIIKERSKDAGISPPDEYIRQIRDATKWVLEFKQQHVGMNVDIKYYRQYPIWRVFICNSKDVYVQPYLAEMMGDSTPLVGFRTSEDLKKYSMAKIYIQMFDRMFHYGIPVQ